MKTRSIAGFLALAMFFSASFGDVSAMEHFCGSGWSRWFVPDSFAQCTFSEACKHHDACYGACDVGGSRAGTAYCDLPEMSLERIEGKRVCDNDFFSQIVADNNGRTLCAKLAAIYRFAVVKYGQGPFNGIMAPDVVERIANASDTPEEAVKKFEVLDRLAAEGAIEPAKIRIKGDELSVPLRSGTALSASEFQKRGKLVLPKGIPTESLEALQHAR